MRVLFRITESGFAAGILMLCLVSLVGAQEISVVDLGTLGGPESKALSINNRGQVVGKSLDALGRTQVFLVNPKDTDNDGDPDLWFEDLNGDGRNDLMINLTPEETKCRPIKINEHGQVLGEKFLGGYSYGYFVITPEDSDNDGKPDVWFESDANGKNALIVEIPTLGGTYIEAVALNNLGQVVGASSTSDGVKHPFLWSASTGTIDLGTIDPGTDGYATDINDKGQVVGWWFWSSPGTYPAKAFRITPRDTNMDGAPDVWSQDGNNDGCNDLMSELVGLGGNCHIAWDINERGQVVGSGKDAANTWLPVLWDETGQPLNLGDLGGGWTEALAINDNGQVIGYGAGPAWDYVLPFFWSQGLGQVLLENTVGDEACAYDVNNLGQVVCNDDTYNHPYGPQAIKVDPETHAYIWSEQTGRIDIIGLDGIANMCHPVAINDQGIIVGSSGSTTYLMKERAALWILRNTSMGTDVPVTPVDPASGESPVTIIFDQVTDGGDTTLNVTATGTPPPNGLKLGNPPHYYVIETTAVYTGPITICVNYTGISYSREANLKLFHHHSGIWENITTSLDTANNIICGSAVSFSEFALFEDGIRIEGLTSPLAELVPAGQEAPLPSVAFKQGCTLPLKVQLFFGDRMLTDADVAAPKVVTLTRRGNAIPLETLDLDSGQANDNGNDFRFAGGTWVYNLSTKGLISGIYTITLEMPDGQRLCAGFVLR